MTMAMPEYLPFDQVVKSWSTEQGVAAAALRAKLIASFREATLQENSEGDSELGLLWAPPALVVEGHGAVRLLDFLVIADKCEYELEPGLRKAGRPVDVVAVGEAALGGRLLLWRAPVLWLARRWKVAAPSWWGAAAVVAELAAFMEANCSGMSETDALDACRAGFALPLTYQQFRRARRRMNRAAKMPRGRPRGTFRK
jgi:hypothetical protein